MKRFGHILFIACVLGILAYRPVTEYDTYFGIKIGEYIVHTGSMYTHEIFSWSAFGRPVIPYEWLAQVWVYLLTTVGGIPAVSLYVSVGYALFFLVNVYLFTKKYHLSLTVSMLLSLLESAVLYEFIVARPQLISFLLFPLYIAAGLSASLPLVFLVLPLTYLWANMHASFVLGPLTLGAYAFVWMFCKNTEKSQRLIITTALSILITLLPPAAPQQYVLLWNFFRDQQFLTVFINEWSPVSTIPYVFISYWAVIFCILLSAVVRFRKEKRLSAYLLCVPMIPVIVLGATAVRHVPYGMIAGFSVIALLIRHESLKSKIITYTAIGALSAVSLFLIMEKRNVFFAAARTMPVEAVNFLRTHHIGGRMFNHLAPGGFLLYSLYPSYQIYFDGRAEVYKDHEMRQYYPILRDKAASPEIFTGDVVSFLNRNGFSFAVLPLTEHDPNAPTANERMADVMLNLPNWQLSYLDDQSVIFVKNNGLNTPFLETFTLWGLTPYRKNEFSVADDTALKKFLASYPSSIGWTIAGEMALSHKKYADALTYFTNAIRINADSGRAYAGRAAAEAAANETGQALSDTRKAIRFTPYLGAPYLTAADIYMRIHDDNNARSILRLGISNMTDLIDRRTAIVKLQALPQ